MIFRRTARHLCRPAFTGAGRVHLGAAAALAVVLAVLVVAPAVAQSPATPDARTVRLKAATFDPVQAVPDLPAVATIDRYGAGERGGFLVQFNGPITDADRAALEAAGASIKGYVPMNTLEIVMTENGRSRVADIPGVRWVGLHQPAYKMAPGLAERIDAEIDPGQKIEFQVSLFPGEDEPAMSRIRGLGRVMKVDSGRTFHIVQVEAPAGRLRGLARIPQVRWVELGVHPIPLNSRSRVLTGADQVANYDFTGGVDPSLDGSSGGFQVKYGHFDGGLHSAHPDFSTPDVSFEPGADSSDLDSGHGTHTASSIVGDGGATMTAPEDPPFTTRQTNGDLGTFRGMQPEAALHHISFDNGYSDRQIFERESEEGAQISSNSWGYGNIQGSVTDYNANAALWDEGVWDADNDAAGLQPLTVFFSAGNDGGWVSPYDGCANQGPDNVGSPGTAKNVITVGNNETDYASSGSCGGAYSGLGSNPEEMNASSSRGPVDPDGSGQGLFKPDITNIGGYWVLSAEAPGTASTCSTQTVNADCPTSGQIGYCSNSGSNYAYYNGTSMSCPLTAGLGGMLYQDLVVNQGVASPKPSLVKALLVNGARDLQPSACNYTFDVTQSTVHQGWGFVQALNSLYGPGGTPSNRSLGYENEVSANAVGTGGSYSTQINATAGTPLKVSLVWTDYPASASAISPLVVNDLNLEVSGPDGTFLGNNFVGNWSVTGGSTDVYNVVENVYIQNPSGGTYTITVQGASVPQDQEPGKSGTNQDFSLVWSGDLGACTPTCGNGTAECDEVCDGGDLGGETCQSQGFDDGVLACNGSCDGLDTSGCFDYVCGNGVREGGEECDGGDIGGATCSSQGCTGGTPSCDGSCNLDYSSCSGCPTCDNSGTCDAGEDCNNCGADCISGSTPGASCGNGICEAADGEDCNSCAADCRSKVNGNPNNRYCCGDGGVCGANQCNADPWQCTETPNPGSSYCCGDGTCEGDENSSNCAVDCGAEPFCGDGTCNGSEDQCSCPSDCGTPPAVETGFCTDGVDNDCDSSVDCNDGDCASDAACQSACDNDGVCEPGEDCNNCGNDCAGKLNGKPSGRYCCGNGVAEPAEGGGGICDGNF